ncbi:hypothetical protein MHYP_G00217060 [Metynnis hypsauchen]
MSSTHKGQVCGQQKTAPTVTTAYASPITDIQLTASKMSNPVTFMTSTPAKSYEPPTSKWVLRETNKRKGSGPVQVPKFGSWGTATSAMV